MNNRLYKKIIQFQTEIKEHLMEEHIRNAKAEEVFLKRNLNNIIMMYENGDGSLVTTSSYTKKLMIENGVLDEEDFNEENEIYKASLDAKIHHIKRVADYLTI